jgi:hypothetical protein
MVCLNDLVLAGNQWRVTNKLPMMTLRQITAASVSFAEYKAAAARGWRLEEDALIKVVGKGNQARTMAHMSLAIFVAEQLSPEFHVQVIKTFIEGKLMEFRDLGGTEFKNLNAAIDLYLPDREGKDNTGCYINAAKLVRQRLLGTEEPNWNEASVAQTETRYELEKSLVRFMAAGQVRNWEHLKELIQKL